MKIRDELSETTSSPLGGREVRLRPGSPESSGEVDDSQACEVMSRKAEVMRLIVFIKSPLFGYYGVFQMLCQRKNVKSA